MSTKAKTMTTADWNERPVFRPDQTLTSERLNRIHEYHATRMRHFLTGLAGPGVVHGFKLSAEEQGGCACKSHRLHVGCGLAIDCWGRQLYWPGGWICIDDLCGDPPTTERDYTLYVHYAERHISGEGVCGCEGHETEWIEESVVFTLVCGCEEINRACPDHCGKCVDLREYVCGRTGSDDAVIKPDKRLEKACDPVPAPCAVCAKDWLYDDKAGLPLACVKVCELTGGRGDCGPKYGFDPDGMCACAYRPYVYRNPLLFELIRGCHLDLARVSKLSFPWQQELLEWDQFTQLIKAGLSVWFTKPIRKSTLTSVSVFVTAIVSEHESYFNDVLRLPVGEVEPLDLDATSEFAGGVKLHFLDVWRKNQFEENRSRFDHGATIELTVRGAMLRDECGCMLDARPLDIPADKPGQGMPGDDFLAVFCVKPKPAGGSQTYQTPNPPAPSAPRPPASYPGTGEWNQP